MLLAAGAAEVPACAQPKPDPAAPPRIKDSVPERAAALRGADGRLKLDVEEERWGVEADKERRRKAAEAAQGSGRTVMIPMPPPNDSGAFTGDGGAGVSR
ncbi:MAG TPA: hypothetical protein VMT47_07065 [Polyangia bacterium]|nr:hypothetical protein [Polyangia bacterium]